MLDGRFWGNYDDSKYKREAYDEDDYDDYNDFNDRWTKSSESFTYSRKDSNQFFKKMEDFSGKKTF